MDAAVREELDRLRELAQLNLTTSNNNLEAINRLTQSIGQLGTRVDETRGLVQQNAEAIAQLRTTVEYLLSKDG